MANYPNDRDNWVIITLPPGSYPLLGMVSSKNHPGLYRFKIIYESAGNKEIKRLKTLLIAPVEQSKGDPNYPYPHITIKFDSSGVMINFHYSEKDEHGKKISYGSEELTELLLLLRPILLNNMTTDDILHLLR